MGVNRITMIKSKKILFFILLIMLLFFIQCSYRYLQKPFLDFSQSTELIGKNTIYCLEQLQEEEINVRIAE